MEKRAMSLVFVSCLFLLATAALFRFWPEREPAYAGKTLSQWVIPLAAIPWPNHDTTAEAAIAHIGPPALPYLTRWIQYRPPQPKGKLLRAIDAVRLKFYALIGRAPSFVDQNTRAVGAQKAFSLIAPQTTNALTELGEIANNSAAADSPTFITSERACYALRDFGAAGVPYLIQLLTKHQHAIAAEVLGYMDTNAFPAIPALIQTVSSPNRGLSETAARALGRLRQEPNLVLPALTACLSSAHSSTRVIAIRALANFDTDALSAAAGVRPLLADPDDSVRDAATNFFRDVDPETVAKARIP